VFSKKHNHAIAANPAFGNINTQKKYRFPSDTLLASQEGHLSGFQVGSIPIRFTTLALKTLRILGFLLMQKDGYGKFI